MLFWSLILNTSNIEKCADIWWMLWKLIWMYIFVAFASIHNTFLLSAIWLLVSSCSRITKTKNLFWQNTSNNILSFMNILTTCFNIAYGFAFLFNSTFDILNTLKNIDLIKFNCQIDAENCWTKIAVHLRVLSSRVLFRVFCLCFKK